MTGNSWSRVEELFQAALEKPAADRAGFLRQACQEDEQVRNEVESLLAHAESNDSFLVNGPVPSGRATEPVLVPGQKLDRFEILELIGSGGMGEVYRARDQRLHRDIAVKVLHSLRLIDASQKRRFIHEAQAASALSHPNIITVYDIGESDGTAFIAMEYVAGKTLAKVISPDGLAPREVVRIAVQIAAALERAHSAGIIHRDFKPGNVMITPEGLVKVLDFGAAKMAVAEWDDQTGNSITSAGVIVGTTDYMSPEQAEGKPLDARSDIFSFGSVLYEMLTGRRPFHNSSGVSTLVSIITKEPPELPAGVPVELRQLVTRCLKKNRDERYSSVSEMTAALDQIRSNLAPAPAPQSTRYLNPWRWLALGLGTLAVAFLFWQVKRKPVSPTPIPQIVRFTSFPGSVRHPSFSPDGGEIVFSWNGEGQINNNIYVKQVGSAAYLRLTTGPNNDSSPAFAPDGRSIGFIRMSQGRAFFMLIPTLGGQPRVVTALAPGVPDCNDVGCNLFSWFPDGKHIVTTGLEIIALESGEKRALTAPPNTVTPDQCPAVSPDGRAVAFVRMPGYQILDVWVVGLTKSLEAQGSPRRVTHGTFNPAPFSLDPSWTPDGREIIFSNLEHLWRVPPSGDREPQILPFQGISPVVSPARDKLAYVRVDYKTWELRRTELGSDGRATGKSTSFALSEGGDMNPQYSPDGKHVAFESSRSGDERIWISEADGSNAVPLFVNPEMYEGSPRWSPDGKFLAFDSNSSGQWHVYVIPASGGTPKRLTNDSGDHNVPTWSRDGKWIYFASAATGRSEIRRIPSQGGQSVQITKNGGFEGWESMDGKSLYFTMDGDGTQGLWRMILDTGGTQQIAPAIVGWGFAVVQQGVYIMQAPEPGRGATVRYLNFATNKTILVKNLETTGEDGLAVSPDGRYLIYDEGAKSSNTDIMLVENFR